MADTKVVNVEGRTMRVPVDATPDEIDQISKGGGPSSNSSGAATTKAAPAPPGLLDRVLGEGFTSTLGREVKAAGEAITSAPSAILGAINQPAESWDPTGGGLSAVKRIAIDPAVEAAKWYAGNEPNKYEKALSVAPEAVGSAGGNVLLGKAMGDVAGADYTNAPAEIARNLRSVAGPAVRGAGHVLNRAGPLGAGIAGMKALQEGGFEHPFVGWFAGHETGRALLGPLADKMKAYGPDQGPQMPIPDTLMNKALAATPYPPVPPEPPPRVPGWQQGPPPQPGGPPPPVTNTPGGSTRTMFPGMGAVQGGEGESVPLRPSHDPLWQFMNPLKEQLEKNLQGLPEKVQAESSPAGPATPTSATMGETMLEEARRRGMSRAEPETPSLAATAQPVGEPAPMPPPDINKKVRVPHVYGEGLEESGIRQSMQEDLDRAGLESAREWYQRNKPNAGQSKRTITEKLRGERFGY